MENYGSNSNFERKVSISTLSGFKFVHTSVLYPLTLQVTVDQQVSSLKLTLLVLLAILSSQPPLNASEDCYGQCAMFKQVTSVPILCCHSLITCATNCSLLLKLSILFLQAKIVPHLTLASWLLVQLRYSRRRVCHTYFLQENKNTAARLLRARHFPRIMRAQVSFGGFSRFSIFQYCQPTRYRQTVIDRYRDHDYIPVYRPTLHTHTSNITVYTHQYYHCVHALVLPLCAHTYQ